MIAGVALRETLYFLRSMGRAGMVRFLLLFIGLLGIFLPWQIGDPTAAVLVFGLLPLYVAGPSGVNAIAGERDRSTLETLLSSPVSPGRLLLGKLAFCAGFGLLAGMLAMGVYTVVSLLAGRPLAGHGAYLAAAALGLLTALLSSLAGMTISVTAKSARSSQQWYSLILVAVALGLPLLVRAALPYIPPEIRDGFLSAFEGGWVSPGSMGAAGLMLVAAGVLAGRLAVRVRRLWTLNGG
jgi:ABC-type transport system involved in multi-copper enzyme maturation permease subunit